MRSIGPAVTREQSPAFLRNSNGRLDFPGPSKLLSGVAKMNGLDGMVLSPSLNFALIMRIRHKVSVPVKEENVETGSRPKRNEVKCERNW